MESFRLYLYRATGDEIEENPAKIEYTDEVNEIDADAKLITTFVLFA